MQEKSFIEITFPIKEVSKESVKEKSVGRHGHISTMHIWWARRPLASSRATIYSALTKMPENEADILEKTNFVINLSKWENSLDESILKRARKDILDSNGGVPPKVLDPFGGGGSIPLEAMRLGCETYASDYNPVATLILKCTLEYPQKYTNKKEYVGGNLYTESDPNKLLIDLRKWGEFVLQESKKEIGEFYENIDSDAIPIGYIWARTVHCQNVSCGAEIPLIRQYWLVRKEGKKIALKPYVDNGKVEFTIVGTGYEDFPKNFDPEKGTVSRAIATCPVCGSVVDANIMHDIFQNGKAGERLIVVIEKDKKTNRKKYRLANDDDLKTYQKSHNFMIGKAKKLSDIWGINAVPDELLPSVGTLGFRIQRYAMNTWGDLFNSRQKLVLITFSEKVRLAYDRMIKEGYEEDYAKVICTYIAFVVSRMSDHEAKICFWHTKWEFIVHAFSRQAIPMSWDYAELNPFSTILTGTYESMFRQIIRPLEHLTHIQEIPGKAYQYSATSIAYPDQYFDAVFTDPPYYDNVPYSYLSDFFYVWLKRMIGHLYPDLFATPLTPKSQEIVAYSNMEGGFESGKKYFEDMLGKSFKEINRVLKTNGIAIIVYAHKSTSAWETLINSLLSSGLVVTAAWPINTEMRVRLRAQDSAALASSIYIIARKIKKDKTGFYNEIKLQMKEHLHAKLDTLWKEGISGADFLISGIASSIELFGRFEEVISDSGEKITTERLMEDVRRIVIDYAVKQVLHNGFSAEIDPITRFYVLWRWAYGNAKVPFDEARKLSQSVGIDLSSQWNGSLIKKDKSFVEVLGPEERQNLENTNIKSVIDLLHKVLMLWKKGQNDKIIEEIKTINKISLISVEAFFRVAQAISESLPNESNEKKLLDGFLINSRERIIEKISEKMRRKIDEY
ncbi:MAG: DUF1156 domain-containing protein [Thermoplasmata archaeon]